MCNQSRSRHPCFGTRACALCCAQHGGDAGQLIVFTFRISITLTVPLHLHALQLTCLKAKAYAKRWTSGPDATSGAGDVLPCACIVCACSWPACTVCPARRVNQRVSLGGLWVGPTRTCLLVLHSRLGLCLPHYNVRAFPVAGMSHSSPSQSCMHTMGWSTIVASVTCLRAGSFHYASDIDFYIDVDPATGREMVGFVLNFVRLNE